MSLAPRRDLQLDALVEVLEGKRLVHAHSYRADEILMLIRLADEMGFKITTFQHVLEGYKVAKEIAAHGAGASTFSDWWGYKIEAADAIPAQRLADDAQGRARLDQLGRRRAGAAAEHGSGQGDPLRRRQRRSGVRDGDDQSGEAAEDRQPRRLDRGRQGRRPGRLEPPSADHRRDRRAHLHRRHRLLRPREGSAAHRRHPEGEGRPADDDRAGAGRRPTARRRPPAAARRRRAEKFDVKGNAGRPDLGDHQRAHRHRLRSGDPEGHDRHQGQPDRGGRRERRRSRRASKPVDAGGATVIPA